MTRELAALDQVGRQIDWVKAERDLAAKLADWQGLLKPHVPQARQILKKLLNGPIQFTVDSRRRRAVLQLQSAHRAGSSDGGYCRCK